MREEFCGVGVLVTFELPCLTSGKDGDDTCPVGRFEVCGRIDENETEGLGGYRRDDACEMEEVGGCVAGVWREEETRVKERFNIRHS